VAMASRRQMATVCMRVMGTSPINGGGEALALD